jgi:hypothetical protein
MAGNSSFDEPTRLTIIGTILLFAISVENASAPGFASPTAFR